MSLFTTTPGEIPPTDFENGRIDNLKKDQPNVNWVRQKHVWKGDGAELSLTTLSWYIARIKWDF